MPGHDYLYEEVYEGVLLVSPAHLLADLRAEATEDGHLLHVQPSVRDVLLGEQPGVLLVQLQSQLAHLLQVITVALSPFLATKMRRVEHPLHSVYWAPRYGILSNCIWGSVAAYQTGDP